MLRRREKLYKEYCNEINDLKSAGKGDKCLRECDTDRLSDILNEILKKGDVPYNSKEARKCGRTCENGSVICHKKNWMSSALSEILSVRLFIVEIGQGCRK